MRLDEHLHRAFLEQMRELENFRMEYTSAHPSVPLERDDPDVRRLVEAMAFFAARTHIAGMRNIAASHRRIFHQLFPYMLTPMPAMCMLQCKTTGQFTETAVLPKGSEVLITSEKESSAIFRTLRDLRVSPVFLREVNMPVIFGSGMRIMLALNAYFPQTGDIGRIGFNINHLNDYQASLRIFYALKEHVRRAFVVFDEAVTEKSRGAPCELSYGAPPANEEDDELILHPIQKEQLFFHFPVQDLFFNVRVPAPPSEWSKMTICLDLDTRWPRNLRLNRDVFQMFAVPAINLRRDAAAPFICDGTKESHPIRHPDPGKKFEFHSAKGVYKIEPEGMVPMRAGILSGISGSYEIEQGADSENPRASRLLTHFPEALDEPRTIAVDALWVQPEFSESMSLNKLNVSLYSRNIAGVKWEILGNAVSHRENRFRENMAGFLHLLTLRNKAGLNLDDLVGMLRALGSVFNKEFRIIGDLLTGIRIEEAPLKREKPGALKHIYHIGIRDFDPGIFPLVDTFMIHLGRILDAWISEAAIEVRMEAAKSEIEP